MRKPLVAAVLCAASVLGVSAGSAVAGEITGQNPARGTPLNAHAGPSDRVGNAVVAPSECAYSGLEDLAGPGTTQTPADYGGAVAGQACRGPADGNIAKP